MSQTANRSINIYVNSGEAERAYDNLVDRNVKLQKQLDRTVQQQKKLVSAIATGDQQAVKENEKLIAKVKELNDTMATNSQRADTLKKKLSGELSPSMKELSTTVARLRKELYSMSQEDAGFKDKVKQYNEAKVALDQYANKIVSVKSKWSEMMQSSKGIAVGMFVGNIASSAVSTIQNYFSSLITDSAKLSDEFSNIKKVSNLTNQEISNLNNSFATLNTRTSNTNLRAIAVGLGQIGQAVTTENVDAINKIVVALGDEFGGGATQITNELGVLRNNLQDIKTGAYDQDMLHIGNAINVLGATGLATGEKTVDIANRIGSVASVYGITAGQVLGMSGAFQELGIGVERGSTAYVKLLGKMATNTDTFAKVAGMSVQEFTNLVNTDMNSALLKVAEGSKNASTNSVEFANILSELETEGAGVTELLSKLGSNTELVTDRINVSTQALTESSSVLSEYAEKNNNLAGKIEKLKNTFNSFKESRTFNDILSAGADTLTKFISVLALLPKYIIDNRNYIIALATAFALYNRALLANAIQTAYNTVLFRAQYAWLVITETTTKLVAIATNAYAFAQGVLTGRITLAVAIQRIQNALSIASGNIFTIVATAVTLLAGAMALYYANISKGYETQKMLNDVNAEASKISAEEKANLESLLLIAQDETIAKAQRLEAIKKINAISPEYLGNLTLENINTAKGTELIQKYIEQLDKKSTAEAIQSKMIELKKKLIEQENSSLEDNVKWYNYLTATLLKSQSGAIDVAYLASTGASAKNKETQAIKSQIDALNKLTTAKVKSGQISVSDIGGGSTSTPSTTTSSTKTDKTKDNLKNTRDELEAFRQKLLEVKRELEGNKLGDNDQLLNNAREKFIQLSEEAKKFKQFFPQLQAEIDKLQSTKLDQVMSGINTKNLESDYAEALGSLSDYFDNVQLARKEDYANGLITEKQYQQALTDLQIDELQARLITIENYEKAGVSKANADKIKAEKDLRNAIADNAIKKAKETEQALAEINKNTDKATKKSIDTISLLPEGVRDNYKTVVGEISQIVGGINTLVGSIGNLLQQQTQQQIDSLTRRTEAEDKKLKDQLDSKLISQEAYDQKKAQLDRKAADELRALRVKQFNQEKAMKLIQAGINVALGVTQAIAQTGVGAIVAGVLVAAAGAAEIALIASAQPPSYGDGTILDGPKHSDKSKGLPIINPYTGQALAYVEGGEAVIPGATVQANRPLINQLLANKGKSVMAQSMSRYMQMPNLNSSRVASNVQMANGGYILNASNKFNSNTTENLAKMQAMNDKYLKDISKYTKTQASKEMSISLTEINRKSKFINGKKAVAV